MLPITRLVHDFVVDFMDRVLLFFEDPEEDGLIYLCMMLSLGVSYQLLDLFFL